jgi:hypothetical protein
MMPLAPGHALAYPCHRRLGNASLSGPPLRYRGIFTPGFRSDSGSQCPTIGRLAGVATRKGASCSQAQFPNPASLPAQKPGFNHPDWS